MAGSVDFQFQPANAAHVQRYTRREMDAIGRYVVEEYAPFHDIAGIGEAIEHRTLKVLARNAFGDVTHARDHNEVETWAVFGSLGRAYWQWQPTTTNGRPGQAGQGVATTTQYRWCTDVPCPTGAEYRTHTRQDGQPGQWTWHDVLGRAIASAAPTPNGTPGEQITAQCRGYDAQGREVRTSIPFFLGGKAEPLWAGNECAAASATLTTYDPLGRPTQVIGPDGTITGIEYTGLITQTTNHFAQRTWERRNVLGERVEVRERVDAQGAPTAIFDGLTPRHPTQIACYAYDATGNLASVTRDISGQPSSDCDGGIVSAMQYDALGRKVASQDPDAGDWTHTYNALGELIEQASASEPGLSTTHRFDARGRVVRTQSYAAGGVLESTTQYIYDSAPNGLGQLAEEAVSGSYAAWQTDPSLALNYQRQLQYDALGRPSGDTTSIDEVGHATRVQYDAFGRPWKAQDASQHWQKTEYDAQGFAVAQCESTQGDFTAQCQYPASTWQRITAVNARGQTTAETRGGQAALSITRSYDALTGRLTGQCVGISCALLDEGYVWDELGNLEYRLKAGQYKEEFQYDSLNRLTQGQFTQLLDLPAAVTSLKITYDALGNLCQKSDLHGTLEYTYGQDAGCGTGGLPGGHSGAGGPQTLAQVKSTPGDGKGGSPVLETYVHDAHGNQTQRSAQTVNRNVRYSASQDAYEITLASMLGTPPRSRFWYGPGGRYKREDSAQGSSTRRTVYLGNVEMITQGGQVQIKRYLAGGLAVQTFDGGLFGRPVTRYLYHDHLGSIVRVADANGALIEGADYGPFGERRGFAHPTGTPAIPETTNKGLTGHEMLDGLDIVHMNGRLYDNRLYRFMQPDPFVQSPGTPQNWNPYSYLWNNPLNGTDPSGYLGVKERQWLGAVITIVAMVTQQYWAIGMTTTQVTMVWIAVGAASGGVSTGSWNGALWGAFSAAVMAGAGSQFGGLSSAPKKFFSMGMAGGVMSSLQGGKFGHGFVSAGTGAVMPGMVSKHISGQQAQTVAAALVGGTVSAMTGGKFANGAAMAAFSYAASNAANRGGSGGEGEWITPEGGDPHPGNYPRVMTNGILAEPRDDFIARVNRTGIPGYYNPSHGFFADIMESVRQKFFGWAGDPLAAGFARGLAGANHPITIIAHSQGTLTVTNAVRYYGLSPQGLTFDMRSPALSHFTASRVIQGRGGTMLWRQPYGDIANIYAPSANPLRWASGFGDIFCGACRHTANGLP